MIARLQGSTAAQKAPIADVGDVEARHSRPVSATVDLTPIAETLRELNQNRREGIITDKEFKTRKAELFERASRP